MRDVVWIVLAIFGWGSWALFEKLAVRNVYAYSAFAWIMNR